MDKENVETLENGTLEKREVLQCAMTEMNLEDIMLREIKTITEGKTLHDSTYMKHLK